MNRNTIICQECGSRNLLGDLTCAECKEVLPQTAAPLPPPITTPLPPPKTTPLPPPTTSPLPAFPTPSLPSSAQMASARDGQIEVSLDRPNYLEAVRFPFRQPDWPNRLWLPALIFFIPVINVIIMRGWRLEITRRLGRGWTDRLPEPNGIVRYFFDGLKLWFMTGIYLIPQFLILLFFGLGPIETLFTILAWLFSPERTSLFGLIGQIGLGSIIQLIVPLVYWALTYPLYRIAMVRFAYTGSLAVFFDVPTNLTIAQEHFGLVVRVYLFEQLTSVLFVFLSSLFGVTGIGVLVVAGVLFPAQYWTTGYLFGSLAAVVQSRKLV
ncbi:MAG: DUF4013 domain-containing protein [Oscillochloridaceae bacterium umkhey_bin13]